MYGSGFRLSTEEVQLVSMGSSERSRNTSGDEMSLEIEVLNLVPFEVATHHDVAVRTRDGMIAEAQLINERMTPSERDIVVGVEADQSTGF